MYQMVRCGMATSQPRDRLLHAAVEHALEAGIADLSLREIASAIGSSHRMLLYHFGSREGLLVAVAHEVERAEREHFGSVTSAADVRRSWDRLSAPRLWPQERLFFELYVHGLRGRPGTEHFPREVVEAWIEPMAAALVAAGAEERSARADARLGVAVTRGLLLDVLATGDRKAATESFDRFLAAMAALGVPPGGEPDP
jgi:AcrR family transcriptional regulator